MKQQVWSSPKTTFEQFVPQNYIAACGDSGVVYKFKCDAGDEDEKYNVYLADGSPYCTSGRDYGGYERPGWGYYHPCGGTHEAESDSGFLKGYMYKQNRYGENTGSKIDVVIWTDNYTNCHTTKELDMDEWETAKS